MNLTIKRAITIVGSQKELARKVGVNQAAVSKWLRGGGIRSQYISAIAAATDGKLSVLDIIHSLSPEATSDQQRA